MGQSHLPFHLANRLYLAEPYSFKHVHLLATYIYSEFPTTVIVQLYSSLTHAVQRRKRQMRNLLLVIANHDFEVGGLSLFACVGGNTASNHSFQCYSKLSATSPMSLPTFLLTPQLPCSDLQNASMPDACPYAVCLSRFHPSGNLCGQQYTERCLSQSGSAFFL